MKIRGPQALRSPEYERLYTDFLSEGHIFAYQQPRYYINKINNFIGKQHHNPFTLTINVKYIDRQEDKINTYLL